MKLPPYQDWVSLECLILRVVYTEPPAITQLLFRFSYPGTGSHEGFYSWVFTLVKLWLVGFGSLQSCGQQFALCPPCLRSSYESKKSCWLFSLFNFLPALRIEWQLPSSQHEELRTKSWHLFFQVFRSL